MKNAVVILALFMFLKPILPVLDYIINYDYIAKELCINKEKPILGCDGKCYLISELAKSSDAEKPISDKKITVKQIENMFFQEIQEILFQEKIIQNFQKQIPSNYSNLYTFLNSSKSFRPPNFIS